MIALLQTGPNVVPMAVVPLVGAALDSGHGPAAFLALSAFLVIVAVANAGPSAGTRAEATPPGHNERSDGCDTA